MKAWDRRGAGGRCGYGVAALFGVLAMLAGPAWAGASQDGGPTIQVVQDGPPIVLSYSFGPYQARTVTIRGQAYELPVVPGEAVLLEAGVPALPLVARSVIIPDDAAMEVRVLSAEYYDTPAQIAPARGNILRSVDPATVPYVFGPTYQVDAFYPAQVAQLGEPYLLRDQRGQVVTVFPLQYNPVQGLLRVYTSMTVEIVPVGISDVNVPDRSFGPRRSQSFEDLYAIHFLNYEPDSYQPLDEEGELLIIVHDAWVANVQPLADHKTAHGIKTTIKKVSEIPNTSTAIQAYIKSVYDTSNLAFVLLVGDASQVKSPTSYGQDPIYAKVKGTDDYPDIMVGRFSAENPDQVNTQVLRTIEYELAPATTQDWFWKGVGIGSAEGPGDDGEIDKVHIENIRLLLLAHGYTQIDQVYDPGASKAAVAAGVNAGRGIITYCGHGWIQGWGTTGFSNPDVAALVNDNQLPFVLSVACNTGEFGSGTCFGEAWLRATHGGVPTGEPTGAIGFYGSSISQSWDPPMEAEDEFANLLAAGGPYHSYGTLCFAGSCSMMDKYGGGGVNEFNHWHIFGDPSLRIIGVLEPPHGLAVQPSDGLDAIGQFGGPFTPPSKDYTLKNKNPTPLDYVVSCTQPWLTCSNPSGTLPGGASVVVTVSFNAKAAKLPTGSYADTVTFTNLTDHDGDCTRAVTLQIGVPSPLFAYALDASPGWPVQGEWAFGKPAGKGGTYGYADPTSGATGTNVYGVNLGGDYSTTPGGPYYLTLGPIDLAKAFDVTLKFKRWLNTDAEPYVFETIAVSTSGSTWTQIWHNGIGELVEKAWSAQEYDISNLADHQKTVWIRWGHQVAGAAWAYSGWNLDDIEVWGVLESGYVVGDVNCDGKIDAFDIDPFVLVLTSGDPPPELWPYCDGDFETSKALSDCNEDGKVDAFDIDPFVKLLTGG